MKLPGVLRHRWAQGCGCRSHSFISALITKKDQHQENTGQEKEVEKKDGRQEDTVKKIWI